VNTKTLQNTQNGSWITTKDGSWTGGFWVGILWDAYQLTDDFKYRDYALKLMEILKSRKDEQSADFDLGFLYYYSFVKGYKITGDIQFKIIALEAAEKLVSFYHESAGLIFTIYDSRIPFYTQKIGSAPIDIMANLSLLWWAYEETKKEEFLSVALNHSKKTENLLIREDGSTYQVVDFDLNDGKILKKGTIHGLNDHSCWARGQTWAIYGYALAYKYSKNSFFYDTFIRLNEYYLSRLPEDKVPFWDFNVSLGNELVKDSSAASITLAAWALVSNLEERKNMNFSSCPIEIFKSLSQKYLQPENREGILGRGCAYFNKKEGIDEATIWGDFYYLDTLKSMLKKSLS